MDNKIFDVSRPGGTAANPSSRPVIVTNQPTQLDPMMAPMPTTDQAITPPAPIDLADIDGPQEETPVSESPVDSIEEPVAKITPAYSESMTAQAPEQPEAKPLHSIAYEGAFFGEIAKPHTFLKHLFIFILVAAIVGGGAFGGWKYLDKKKQDDKVAVQKAADEKSAKDSAAAAEAKKAEVPAGFKKYQDKDLNISFLYPEKWGVPTATTFPDNAKITEIQNRTYSFTDPKVGVNIVVDPVNAGSDGDNCSPTPLEKRTSGLFKDAATVVGWSDESLIIGDGTSTTTPTLDSLNFTKLTSKDKVLAYKIKTPEVAVANTKCKFTQADADKANEYNNIVYYAANFTTTKVKGTNAQYWASATLDQTTIDQIIAVLNSLTKI